MWQWLWVSSACIFPLAHPFFCSQDPGLLTPTSHGTRRFQGAPAPSVYLCTDLDRLSGVGHTKQEADWDQSLCNPRTTMPCAVLRKGGEVVCKNLAILCNSVESVFSDSVLRPMDMPLDLPRASCFSWKLDGCFLLNMFPLWRRFPWQRLALRFPLLWPLLFSLLLPLSSINSLHRHSEWPDKQWIFSHCFFADNNEIISLFLSVSFSIFLSIYPSSPKT